MFGIGCSERVQIGNYIRIKKKAIYIRGFQEFILDTLMSKLNIYLWQVTARLCTAANNEVFGICQNHLSPSGPLRTSSF